jgi:hypothetical protein
MTPRTLKCKEIQPLLSSSEFLRVPEDSIFPLSGMNFILTLIPKWGCNTLYVKKNLGKRMCGRLQHDVCDAGVG